MSGEVGTGVVALLDKPRCGRGSGLDSGTGLNDLPPRWPHPAPALL